MFNQKMLPEYSILKCKCFLLNNSLICLKVHQELAPWDTWDEQKAEKVRSVEEYRQWQQMQRQHSEEPEPEPDFFQDMTPTLKKQRKVQCSTGIFINVFINKILEDRP